jgi:hypothetical protein
LLVGWALFLLFIYVCLCWRMRCGVLRVLHEERRRSAGAEVSLLARWRLSEVRYAVNHAEQHSPAQPPSITQKGRA